MDCKNFLINLFKRLTPPTTTNNMTPPTQPKTVVISKIKSEVKNKQKRKADIISVEVEKDTTIVNEIVEEGEHLLSSPENSIEPLRYTENEQYYYVPPEIYKHVYHLYENFYMARFKNDLIFFGHYSTRHCPLKGWFQECLKCNTITGNLHTYGHSNNRKLRARMCLKCSNHFDKYPDDMINDDIYCLIKNGLEKYKDIILYR